MARQLVIKLLQIWKFMQAFFPHVNLREYNKIFIGPKYNLKSADKWQQNIDDNIINKVFIITRILLSVRVLCVVLSILNVTGISEDNQEPLKPGTMKFLKKERKTKHSVTESVTYCTYEIRGE